jgi:hypothetical protein
LEKKSYEGKKERDKKSQKGRHALDFISLSPSLKGGRGGRKGKEKTTYAKGIE